MTPAPSNASDTNSRGTLAVFSDFDGTIARRDVGYNLFHHFSNGKNVELLPDWKSGRLSTRDCLLREAEMVRATRTEIYRFLEQFALNAGFKQFAGKCRELGIELTVVSDGLDFYIKDILGRNGLDYLPVIANRGILEDGRINVEFIHHNRTCRRCGSCKGERIMEYRRNHPAVKRIAFVGDGFSDACAVHEADLIFAKKDLERYCRNHNIEYCPYDDFFDVMGALNM